MKLIDERKSTLAHTFHIKVVIDTVEEFERAMSIAFNERAARYVAATRHFGLIFLENVESGREVEALIDPVKFEVEPQDMSGHKAPSETYSIQSCKPPLTTGQAVEYALEWLGRLDDDHFQYIAGIKHQNWELTYFPGVTISTGFGLMGHIGMHSHSICYVKPTWLAANRNF